jgi:Zn-dependent alcohol dehydrogenase
LRAAVCRAAGEALVIEDVTLAPPGPGEVEVRIAACAICHSDVAFLAGEWATSLPAVFGHEAAGIVERVGQGVRGVAPGDHVVVTLIRACGRCRCCQQGQRANCETRLPLDERSPLASAADGAPLHQGLGTAAFAERVVVDASQVVGIEPDIALESAALLACGVITGVGAVTNTARVPPGASVVVVGCGGVGLNAIQGARLVGAGMIGAIDVAASKLDAAQRFGATDLVDASSEDPEAAVRRLTRGRGAEYVLVTVGAARALEQALTMLAPGGAMVIVGMPADGIRISVDPCALAARGQRILGSKMGASHVQTDIPALIALYRQGRLLLDELITARYPLDWINQAIETHLRGESLRNVILFD